MGNESKDSLQSPSGFIMNLQIRRVLNSALVTYLYIKYYPNQRSLKCKKPLSLLKGDYITDPDDSVISHGSEHMVVRKKSIHKNTFL